MEDLIIAAHRVPLLFKFCRKEFSLSYPLHEDLVALPEIEIQNVLVRDPFQCTFRRVDQLTGELNCSEDKNVPVIAFELREHEQAAMLRRV